ncbi:MAG: lytic transglycosylase domain-containing protein [Runella sp.]
MKNKQCIILSTLLLSSLGANAEGFNESSCIRFCNEPLPIYQNQVLRHFESALRHTASMTAPQIRTRATYFFNTIEPILAQYQIPLDFKYLCIVESTFSATAMSPKGAYGYWQFMPHTARAMGLVVNDEIDERENLVKSTHAACRYFLDLYRELGSWSMVAAAYNAGPTKVKAFLARHGKHTSYYHLRISPENQRYLYRVLAAKELLSRPEVYAKVFAEELSFSQFFRQFGVSLGLVSPPKVKKQNNTPLKEIPAETISDLTMALLTGFEEMIPLVFKRNALALLVRDNQEEVSLINQNLPKKHRVLWWPVPRINTRKRNDLKTLLAEARPKSSLRHTSKLV